VIEQLWLPEGDGLFNDANSAHQALLMLLGCQSRREVLRSRFRTAARCGRRPAITDEHRRTVPRRIAARC